MIERTGRPLSLFFISLFSTNFYGEVNEQRRNWRTYWSTNNRPAGQASELAVSFSPESTLHQWASGLKHFAPPANTASPCFSVGRGTFQSGLLKEVQKIFMTADNMIMSLVWKSLALWLYRYIFSLSSSRRKNPPLESRDWWWWWWLIILLRQTGRWWEVEHTCRTTAWMNYRLEIFLFKKTAAVW